MSKRKKLSLVTILFLLTVIFVGIGGVVARTTPDGNNFEQNPQDDSEQQETEGKNGEKKAAEKLIGQTYSCDEIK